MSRLFRDVEGGTLFPHGSVVCIGAFDGLHLGHQALVRHAVERARALGVPAVAVSFDQEVVSPEIILDLFFTSHDPTSLNRQGADEGPQYRSSMFYADQEQQQLFQEAIERMAPNFERPIVTTLEPLGTVWEAEPVHQDFYARQPYNGYCQFVINPKLAKVRQGYAEFLTTS